MTKTYTMNNQGFQNLRKQYADLTGTDLDYVPNNTDAFCYEIGRAEEQRHYEDHPSVEIGGRKTLSGHPEFAFFEPSNFDVIELDEEGA